MKQYHHTFLKYISVIQRNYYKYMDMKMGRGKIGCGQYFFLTYIYERDGISMYDLAKIGHFDKGTVTKAVQKLAENGYIVIQVDEKDRRIKHLHVTEKAREVVERVYQTSYQWKDMLLSNLTEQEEMVLMENLKQMAEESCKVISGMNEEKGEKRSGK